MDITRELNYDILHLIMSMCKRNEISMMMKTCKLLNLHGAKLLLSSELVELRSEEDIISFTTFMLGGSKHLDRFAHPLRVHITAESLSKQSAADLRDFLFDYGHLLRFRALTISHAEQLLAIDPQLPIALAEIGFAKYLGLTGAGPLARDMIQKMKNEVFDFSVSFMLRDTDYLFLPDDYENNPILVLEPLCHRLCSVSGTWGATDPAKDVYEGIVFHGVTSLDLCTKDPIHVPHYARAFPNVVNLGIITSSANELLLEDAQVIATYAESRNRNRTAQRAHGSWARLGCFSGTVFDWWALALECEVERVRVSDLLDWHFDMFGELLRIARPKYLELDVRAFTAVVEDFGALFRRQSTHFLAGLRVDVSFDIPDRDELDAGSMLDTVVAACAGTAQLRWLQINLHCSSLRFGFLPSRIPHVTPISPPEAFFRQLDLHALAQRLKREVPTLRGLSVRIQALRGREFDTIHLGEQFPPDTEWDKLDQHLAG
ncbi:hypothetical protein C8T65DRAFT_268822 [Cerioporus squamosus]|nr:hypothetical protein C8T65DRAFT_268822 [Cerioporus squamosus]